VLGLGVLPTVQLDGESRLVAVEVEDVPPEWVLPAELRAG